MPKYYKMVLKYNPYKQRIKRCQPPTGCCVYGKTQKRDTNEELKTPVKPENQAHSGPNATFELRGWKYPSICILG